MFTFRPVGCAVFILAFITSFCQAASVPFAATSSTGRVPGHDDVSLAELFGATPSTTPGILGARDSPSPLDITAALGARDVYSPKITLPSSSTKWKAGDTVLVKWDTSNPPKTITNRNSKIVLGYIDDHTSNEHLDLNNPLATNFDIMKGSQKVTVPQVPPGNRYIVVLFGDSGNRSPEFTIN